jgi:hypothetical protein
MVGNGERAGSLIKLCIVLDLRGLAMDSFVLDLGGNVRNCGKSRNIAKAYKYKGLLSVFLYCSKCSICSNNYIREGVKCFTLSEGGLCLLKF